jgi:hypothetical protein
VRQKFKTYKDLVNVAEEIGHRELIYQFLEVHRHMAHYQNVKSAANGLNMILMQDTKLKEDLKKIAPKILLLSFDPNEEISQTMKQLWQSVVVDLDKEAEFIDQRWPEIMKMALSNLNCTPEWRKREGACNALSELLP